VRPAQRSEDVAIEVRADHHVVELRLHHEHAHVVDDAVVDLLEVVLVVLRDLIERPSRPSVNFMMFALWTTVMLA